MDNFRVVDEGRGRFFEFIGELPTTVDELFDVGVEKWALLADVSPSKHPIMDGGANTCVFCISARPAILTCSGCPIALADHKSCQDTPYIDYVDLTDCGGHKALKYVIERYGLDEDTSFNEVIGIVAGMEAKFIDSLRETESIRCEMEEYLAIKKKMSAHASRLTRHGWFYMASVHMSKRMYRRDWECWMNWQTGDISYRRISKERIAP